jgi:hypothetical protein
MFLQFHFYLETRDGHRLQGETILFGSTTLDVAIDDAQTMLKDHTFPFGKANLCVIKDKDGRLIREVRTSGSP